VTRVGEPVPPIDRPGPPGPVAGRRRVATRGSAVLVRLVLVLALSAVLPLLSVVYLVLPQFFPVGGGSPTFHPSWPFLAALTVLLGILQLSFLYRFLDSLRRPPAGAGAPEPAAHVSEVESVISAIGQNLQALLASPRSDEVGALMREFTRILGVLQQLASQVHEYAGRFEAINEELRNANLRLREMSLTDELTEVGNRRSFDMRMREEINRSSRFGHAFSLLFLDIDGFKRFNDEFGHPAGDTALHALGALMRSMSREGDVPCRIGGEEFAFILPETGKGDAVAFAERIRRGVEASISAPGGKGPLTVSIGLAAFPDDGKTQDELLRDADEALYQSKRTGRNRVTAYSRR